MNYYYIGHEYERSTEQEHNSQSVENHGYSKQEHADF